MQTTKVLGIDPGLDRTGWAILEGNSNNLKIVECGLLSTPKTDTLAQRLEGIYTGISQIIQRHNPDDIAMEELFFVRLQTSVYQTIQARGVIVLACKKLGIENYSYSPKKIKSILCGNGNADKKQVQHTVKLMMKLEKAPSPDDIADAIAIAIAHLKLSPLKARMNVQKEFLEKVKKAKAELKK